MLPLVINNNPNRLVQVSMTGSVGVGGRNARPDVILIQTLLNAIPSIEGGPQTKLAIDGLSGPLTAAAIRRYQQARTTVVDGRVDAGGSTIKSLVTVLNDRNALPRGLPNLGPPSPEIVRALTGGGSAMAYSQADQESGKMAFPVASGHKAKGSSGGSGLISTYTGPTGWKFKTSSGFDFSVAIGGAIVANIFMTHDIEPGRVYRFTFLGLGVGLSNLPVGFDISLQKLPSHKVLDFIRSTH